MVDFWFLYFFLLLFFFLKPHQNLCFKLFIFYNMTFLKSFKFNNLITTFGNGSLGSCNDEERSEMR